MLIHIRTNADSDSPLMMCGKIKRRKSLIPLPIYCTPCVERLFQDLIRRGIARGN